MKFGQIGLYPLRFCLICKGIWRMFLVSWRVDGKLMIALCVVIFLYSALMFAHVFLIKNISKYAIAGHKTSINNIIYASIQILLVKGAREVLALVFHILVGKLESKIFYFFQKSLLKKMIHFDIKNLSTSPIFKSITCITVDVQALSGYIANLMIKFRCIAQLFVCFLIFLYYDARMALLFFLTIALIFFSLIGFWHKMYIWMAKLRSLYDDIVTDVGDTLRHLKIIKLYRLEKKREWVMDFVFKKLKRAFFESQINHTLSIFVANMIGIAGRTLIVFIAAILTMKKDIKGSDFMVIFTTAHFTASPIHSLTGMFGRYQKTNVSFKRIMSILNMNTKNNAGNEFGSKNMVVPKTFDIDLSKVCFSIKGKELLKDINVTFKKGISYIVGASGAGKTTLCNFIAGVLTDDIKGSMLIGGIDFKKVDYSKVLSYIGYDSMIFRGTIKENIVVGFEDRVDENLMNKVVSDIAPFVFDLLKGLNESISNLDCVLSDGQRQCLGIVRSILHPGNICIIDEGTSCMDFKLEKLALQAIEKYAKHKTTIIVSHRLNLIQKKVFCVLMDSGKIKLQGDYSKIIKEIQKI